MLCSWHFPGKNIGLCCQFLLQGIFPTQRLNPRFPHWQLNSLPLSHKGNPVEIVEVKERQEGTQEIFEIRRPLKYFQMWNHRSRKLGEHVARNKTKVHRYTMFKPLKIGGKKVLRDLPGDPVAENSPYYAGHTGLYLVCEQNSHRPWDN